MCYDTMSNVMERPYGRQTAKSNVQDLSDSRLLNFVIISMRYVVGIQYLRTNNPANYHYQKYVVRVTRGTVWYKNNGVVQQLAVGYLRDNVNHNMTACSIKLYK